MSRNGIKISIDQLTYPSSNLTVFKDDGIEFSVLEKESMMLNIILRKYYPNPKNSKFVGNIDEFRKDMKYFKYPIQAYKLGHITTDIKKVNAFLRDFKKRLVEKEKE